MHPQIIFQISQDRYRENLARAEQGRLARSADVRAGGSYPHSPLARLARWARGFTGRAGAAQPAPGLARPGGRAPQGPGQPERVLAAVDQAAGPWPVRAPELRSRRHRPASPAANGFVPASWEGDEGWLT